MKKSFKLNNFEIESINNEKLWQITLDAMNEAVFLINLDHKILLCNKATLEFLGKSSYDEIIGHSCGDLVHVNGGPVEWCPVRKMWETGHREADIQLLNGKWVEISADPIHNSKGDIIGAVHVINDIDANKKTEDALRESEQQYLKILNSLNDAMHVVDKDLRIIFQNPAMYQWLKFLDINPDIKGKTIFEAFPFLDRDKVLNEYNKIFSEKEPLITIESTKLSNRLVYTQTLKIPIIREGKVNQIITILRDITNQKEAELNLRLSEEKYKNIISHLMDIVIILDLKGNFQFVSPQIYEIAGFKPEEVIGKNGFKFMHPDDAKNAAETLRKAIQNKNKVYIEYRTIHKDGYYIDVSASGRIVNFDGEDKIFAVVKDITEQKSAKQKLTESEEKYRLITENVNDMIAILNDRIEYEYINEAAFRSIVGRGKEDLIGRYALQWVHPDDMSKCITAFEVGWEQGESNVQARFQDTKGKYHWLDVRGKKIYDVKGEEKVLIVSRDISERKEYEKKLEISEEKYRYLIENALEGVWAIDSNIITTLVNPTMANILGYSVEEMIGKSLFSFMDEEEIKTVKLQLENRKKGISGERDGVYIHKNGKKVFLRIRATPIFDTEGNYGGTYAFLADITHRKIAEQKLKESEEKFRTMAEQSFMGIIILQDGIFKYFNEQAVIINGYSKEEIQNWEPYEFQKLIYPDDREFVMEQARKKQSGVPDAITHYQYRVVRKDGEIIWVENFSKTINYEGRPADFVLTIDISDKIKAEESIKESEEKYRLISENTDDMIVVFNEDGTIDYLNAETHSKVLGYSPENFKDKSFRDSIVHKDDIDISDKNFSEVTNRRNFYSQFRLKHKSGEYLWFEVTGKSFLDKYGNKKLLCVSRNINEEKLAKQKIKESEENFRTIAEQAFIGTLIIQDDKVEYVNNALLQIFDFSYEEVENWKKSDLLKLIFPEDLQYLKEYRAKLRSGESDIKQYYSYRVFTKYGKIKWIDQYSRPIIYRGKPAELITIMDITEKKKAEEELIKLNSLKSELLRRTSHELKTPLVSIKGFSDLLLTVHRDKLDDYVLATIREIKLGCERLENLIQDILKTAELESESVEIKKSEEDLSFLIKLCVRELQGLIRLRNHEINLDIHDKLLTKFEPDQLHLVLSNLINNAIKYTPPNGKIDIKSAITDEFILISIEDNGIGITNEEKKRLFSQFGKIERYGQGLDIISEGSGLGLYITKKIIELHGGTIRVKSKGRNKGSTFYFTLPVIKDNFK
ncbi:MAG: PAS domain S-box protein [Candidatus Hermodarchaeota archaeon]